MADTPEPSAVGSAAVNRRAFEDYVRSQWTAGYSCPRVGDGYEDAKVDFAWRALCALAAHPTPDAPQADERRLLQLIDERDERQRVIDAILDLVLGDDRPEWSSAYGFAEAINDVDERMVAAGISKAAVPLTMAQVDKVRQSLSGAGYDIYAFAEAIGRKVLEVNGITTASPASCKRCDGAGGWEAAASSTHYHWVKCPDCAGPAPSTPEREAEQGLVACVTCGHPAPSAAEPDMRAICAALGFDPTNHHNAAKCPYCRAWSTT